jgi:hypothetical protein
MAALNGATPDGSVVIPFQTQKVGENSLLISFDFVKMKLGWSDDRVAPPALSDPVSAALSRLSLPTGFIRNPFPLDPESVPRVGTPSFRSLFCLRNFTWAT